MHDVNTLVALIEALILWSVTNITISGVCHMPQTNELISLGISLWKTLSLLMHWGCIKYVLCTFLMNYSKKWVFYKLKISWLLVYE